MREENLMQNTREIEHIFDEVNVKSIEKRLRDIKGLLHSAQSEVDMLMKQRTELVATGNNQGLSVIKMGELLGITRQRVYILLETANEEE